MTTFGSAGYGLAKDDGQHIWFLGTLMTVKAGMDQTRGGFTLIEQVSLQAAWRRGAPAG